MENITRRTVRPLPAVPQRDLDEQRWLVDLAILVCAGIIAWWTVRTSSFDLASTAWWESGYFRLGLIGVLLVFVIAVTRWLDRRVKRRMQLCTLLSFLFHVVLIGYLSAQYLASRFPELARVRPTVVLPDYGVPIHARGERPQEAFEQPSNVSPPDPQADLRPEMRQRAELPGPDAEALEASSPRPRPRQPADLLRDIPPVEPRGEAESSAKAPAASRPQSLPQPEVPQLAVAKPAAVSQAREALPDPETSATRRSASLPQPSRSEPIPHAPPPRPAVTDLAASRSWDRPPPSGEDVPSQPPTRTRVGDRYNPNPQAMVASIPQTQPTRAASVPQEPSPQRNLEQDRPSPPLLRRSSEALDLAGAVANPSPPRALTDSELLGPTTTPKTDPAPIDRLAESSNPPRPTSVDPRQRILAIPEARLPAGESPPSATSTAVAQTPAGQSSLPEPAAEARRSALPLRRDILPDPVWHQEGADIPNRLSLARLTPSFDGKVRPNLEDGTTGSSGGQDPSALVADHASLRPQGAAGTGPTPQDLAQRLAASLPKPPAEGIQTTGEGSAAAEVDPFASASGGGTVGLPRSQVAGRFGYPLGDLSFQGLEMSIAGGELSIPAGGAIAREVLGTGSAQVTWADGEGTLTGSELALGTSGANPLALTKPNVGSLALDRLGEPNPGEISPFSGGDNPSSRGEFSTEGHDATLPSGLHLSGGHSPAGRKTPALPTARLGSSLDLPVGERGLSPGSALMPGVPGSPRGEPLAPVTEPALVPRVGRLPGGLPPLPGPSGPELKRGFVRPDPAERLRIAEKFGGSKETESAVEKGLEFLARYQFPDGRWRFDAVPEGLVAYPELDRFRYRADTAATGLAILAFLGAGYTHLDGKYAATVAKGLDWLISAQKADGSLFDEETEPQRGPRMYAHGIASIALCEALGMTGDEALKPYAEKAIGFILAAQDPQYGGWRYTKHPQQTVWVKESDTSVSGWQLLALKSAELAGLTVPPSSYRRVEKWLAVAALDGGAKYCYSPFVKPSPETPHPQEANLAMTAEGLLMRLLLGWNRQTPQLLRGVEFLASSLPEVDLRNPQARDAYYWYYATQVMFYVHGSAWERWNKQMQQALLPSQEKEGPFAGSWHPAEPVPDRWAHAGGRIYVTTLHLLMLEVYYRHLPLFKELSPR